jgi:tRNA 2-thiouridine synthesizing protein A
LKNDKVILMNSEEIIKPDRVLGCVGLYCPVPIFNTALEMEKIEPGQILEVVNNDPAAVQDIPRWAKRAGHRLLKLSKKDENFHFLIRKGL